VGAAPSLPPAIRLSIERFEIQIFGVHGRISQTLDERGETVPSSLSEDNGKAWEERDLVGLFCSFFLMEAPGTLSEKQRSQTIGINKSHRLMECLQS
jgi:hypothetical protein